MTQERLGAYSGKTLALYQLHELVGTGGGAEVYRGVDPALARDVAVKVLRDELSRDPEFVRRFRTEARLVAGLTHPHIIPIYQLGEEDGHLFLVMPLLRGGSLRDRLQLPPRCPSQEAVQIALQIAEALAAAHAAHLLHRDVKPENVLFTSGGEVVLTDFGLARDLPAEGHAPAQHNTTGIYGIPVGTPAYMAPEQFQRTATLDARVDVYALGVVLYEMLTGRLPFSGTPQELATSAHRRICPTPSQVEPSVWPALDPLVMTALAADPMARYRTAAELAAALRRTWEAYTAPSVPQTGQEAGAGSTGQTGQAIPSKGSTEVLPSMYQLPTPPELLGPEPWPIGMAAASLAARDRERWPLLALIAVLLIGVVAGTGVLLAGGTGFRGQPASGLGQQVMLTAPPTQTSQNTAVPYSTLTSTATVPGRPSSTATSSTPGPTGTPTPSAAPTASATLTATPTPSGIVTLSGTVTRVDTATSSFSCQTSSSTNLTVVTTNQTQFTGDANKLSDLQAGTRVTVIGSYQTDGTLLARTVQSKQ
jgi:serine/threonine-protein kinase